MFHFVSVTLLKKRDNSFREPMIDTTLVLEGLESVKENAPKAF